MEDNKVQPSEMLSLDILNEIITKLLIEYRIRAIKAVLDSGITIYSSLEDKNRLRQEQRAINKEFLEQLFEIINNCWNVDIEITSDQAALYDTARKHLIKASSIASSTMLKETEEEVKQYTELLQSIFETKEQTTPLSKRSAEQLAEALKSILPAKHVKPNNKLANEITRDFINEGKIELRVSRNGAKKEIITKAMLTYDDKNINLSGRATFTPYDREVHDGVVTLYAAGNEIITPEMVYRAMNGMTETEKISPQAVGAVTRSLDKTRRIMVNIDFSQEAQAYKKDCKATYEGYLLACDKLTVSTGGKTKEAYKLLRKPILYDYAQISGQVITVPIGLLQTKEAVRSTEDVIVIRGYLLRQIEGMKSPTFRRSNKITYEGIYTELEMNNLSEKAFSDKSLKIRRHIEAILKEWINQNYIKGYSQYKESKNIKGITIAF